MRTISMAFIFLLSSYSFAEDLNFRDRIRLKIKERIIKKQSEVPAPEISETSNSINFKPGDYIQSIISNNLTRFYKIHIPKSYNGKSKVALLFALHGGGGDMEIQSNDKYYHQISKSEKEGYIVVFPNGFSQFKSGKFATWNAGKCCGEARDKKIDDAAFFRELILKLKNQFNIDDQKIYFTGMSNGAMMSYRLACELSDVLSKIATVAGTDNTIDCLPKKPISIFHIHAEDDDHVLFNGGLGPKALSKNGETEFTSVTHTLNKWIEINKCPKNPSHILKNENIYCDQYFPCANNTKIKLCVTKNGGHSWPGGEKPRGGKGSDAIDATEAIWEFFEQP